MAGEVIPMHPPQSDATGASGPPRAAGAPHSPDPAQIAARHTLNASLARYKNAMAALAAAPPGSVPTNERKALIDRFLKLETTAESIQGQIDKLGDSPQQGAVDGLTKTLQDFQSSVLAFVDAVRDEVQGVVPMGPRLGQAQAAASSNGMPGWAKWSLAGVGVVALGWLGWSMYANK